MRNLTKILIVLSALFSNFVFSQEVENLSEGNAKSVTMNSDISSVFISNPKIADYKVIDKRTIVLFGRSVGESTFMAFDSQGQELTNRKIVVSRSYSGIEQQVKLRFPTSKIDIYAIGTNAVVSGTVLNEEDRDKIYELVGTLLFDDSDLDDQGDRTELTYMDKLNFEGVVNQIEVARTKQVNVKLTIAEVSHSFMQDFGIKVGSNGQAGIFVDQLVHFSASDIVSVITAVGTDSVGQVLAEPNLSVISGEDASFLVGGELPVVTVIDGATNVQYKEFGVKLDLTAKVERDDKIKLALAPSVSSLDAQYSNDAYDLPSLKTRSARTTVELGDGQSFVLGGLLNSEERESLTRIPFIGDIPILGALFRHTGTERNRTELIIVATVNLVQPVKANQIQLPTMQKTSTLRRFLGMGSDYDRAEDKWASEILNAGGFRK
ncbi:type II and III secretion system protein family protein [Aliivibrio wodanis]|uniref:type II and III secretion system protein family protein n=1 Tax=Aliivibrio wodanis TaxID=80852 RepID=UPI00406C4ADD